jgi:predicted nuclease of predicted toxin-antitoxin system
MEEPDSDFGFILQTSDSDFGFRLQIQTSDFQIVSIPSPDSDVSILSPDSDFKFQIISFRSPNRTKRNQI